MVYYIVLFLIIVFHFLVKNRDKFCTYVGILLVLFAGLRGAYVGPDTYQYQWIFEDIQHYHNTNFGFFFLDGKDSQTSEPGYNFFQTMVGLIANYEVFKILCAFIQTVPAIILIRNYSNNILMSLVIYFCLPVFSMMSMSMMRQGIAFGIFLLSYKYILERKFYKYIVCILCAALFHTSALILIPLYFVYSIPYKKKYIWLILFILCLVYLFSQALYSFMISFARIEYEMSDSKEGFKMLIFMMICLSSSMLVKEKILNSPVIRFQFYLLVYTIALWMIGMNLASVLRLAAYTEFFLCLYIPNLLGLISDINLRKLVQWCACIVCVLIMQNIVLMKSSDSIRYVPYYFFWEKRPIN